MNSTDVLRRPATLTIDYDTIVSPIRIETMATIVRITRFQLRETPMDVLVSIAREAFNQKLSVNHVILHYMMHYVHYSMTLTNNGGRNGQSGYRQQLR